MKEHVDNFQLHVTLGFADSILEPFPAAKTIIDKDIK